MTLLLIAIFILGYAGIALEHQVRVNKAATALLIGVLCWTVYILDIDRMMPEGSVPSWFTSKMGMPAKAT